MPRPDPQSGAGPPGSDASRRATRECDRHGGALLLLATALTGHRGSALDVTVAVLVDHCLDPSQVVAVDATEARRHLCRQVFRHCGHHRAAPASGSPVSQAPAAETDTTGQGRAVQWLARTADLQVAALALCLYGRMRVDEVAELLEISADQVSALLRHGLGDLASTSALGATTSATDIVPAEPGARVVR